MFILIYHLNFNLRPVLFKLVIIFCKN